MIKREQNYRNPINRDGIYKFNSILQKPWVNLIKDLQPVVNVIHGKPFEAHVAAFANAVDTLVKNKGKRQAIKVLKQYRLIVQQYCLRQEVERVPFTKCDKDGFPRIISWAKPDKDNAESMMYSLSILRIIEEFKCEPSEDVSTIIEPSTADPVIIEQICDYIDTNPPILKVLPELEGPIALLSNKAGPNGPASISALKDLASLQGTELLETIEERLDRYGSDILPSNHASELPEYEGIHSKLVLLPDKACKTRVIAIADWWSNLALSNLHVGFMRGLRRLVSDATYHQDKLGDLVKGLGLKLYSSDMTAFTDRFPRILEKKVVSAVYGEQEAHEWELIISGREFYHRKIGTVTYNVGNPMGVLSSWAVSSFTHHVVKSWCAHSLGIKYRKYLILGDDTLDSNKDVYLKYLEVIRSLGVSINVTKCTHSEDGYTEVAKRLFTPNGEITGMPVHLISTLKSSPEQFIELLRICRSRGYKDKTLRPALLALLKNYKKFGSLIACIFALPKELSGSEPLFTKEDLIELERTSAPRKEGNVFSSIHDNISGRTPDELASTLRIARDYLFWKRVDDLLKDSKTSKATAVEVSSTHPLWYTLYNKAEMFQPEGAWLTTNSQGETEYLDKPDPYYLYKQWMSGNYREMAVIPSISPYKYYNKGHYDTKCKFDVLHVVIKLLRGDCNIPLHYASIYSDKQLFKIALYRILPETEGMTQEMFTGEMDNRSINRYDI